MKLPPPLEALGRELVESVRDEHLDVMLDILAGEHRSIDGRAMFDHLTKAGIGTAQYDALRRLLIQSTDMLLGRLLAFAEHQVSQGNLKVNVSSAESGENYTIEPTDMLGAAYYSDNGWVQRYGKFKG